MAMFRHKKLDLELDDEFGLDDMNDTGVIARVAAMKSSHSYFEIGRECGTLLKLVLPMMAVNFLTVLMQLVDLSMVGHLGTEFLGAATIAISYSAIPMFVGFGLITAIDTLCSQSFGSERHAQVGLWLQRGFVVMVVYWVFLGPFYWFAETLLLKVALVPSNTARLAGKYVFLLYPGLLPLFLFQAIKSYLQAQYMIVPLIWISLLCNLLNAGLDYTFIFGVGNFGGWGFFAAPVVTSISRLLLLVFSLLYVRCVGWAKLKETWPALCARHAWSWRGFSALLLLAVPGGIMVGVEDIGFEVEIMLSAQFGPTDLAAFTVLMNIFYFLFFTFSTSFGGAGTVRVGSLLGAQQPFRAQLAGRILFWAGLFFHLLTFVVIMLTKSWIGAIFTSNRDVIRLVAKHIPIAATFHIVDGVQGICAGIMRGMGRPILVAVWNLFGFWVCGFPVSVVLAFGGNFGSLGLWFGLAVGLAVVAVGLTFHVTLTNWPKQSANAVKRMTTELPFGELNDLAETSTRAQGEYETVFVVDDVDGRDDDVNFDEVDEFFEKDDIMDDMLYNADDVDALGMKPRSPKGKSHVN